MTRTKPRTARGTGRGRGAQRGLTMPDNPRDTIAGGFGQADTEREQRRAARRERTERQQPAGLAALAKLRDERPDEFDRIATPALRIALGFRDNQGGFDDAA